MTLGKRSLWIGSLAVVLMVFSSFSTVLASPPAESVTLAVSSQMANAAPTPPYANGFTPASNPTKVFFQDCGHYLSQGFLNFWRKWGGNDLFGCPISEELTENGRTVQYFQKARLEYHPDLAGTQWETSLGLLGTELLQNASPEELANPAYKPIVTFPTTKDKAYFDLTQHSLGGEFYTYWKNWGGVYRFGYPTSEEYPQLVDGQWMAVQDFERSRFIYHPSFGVKQLDMGQKVAALNKINTAALDRDPLVVLYAPDLWAHWVDVSRNNFTATFMDGDVPIRSIKVVLGKPGHETPLGTFKIFQRVANEHMRGGEIGTEDFYDLDNVLYTQYFTGEGHALHYAWWRSTFGYAASHGCVNMNLDDSSFAWNFLKIGDSVNIHL